MLLGRIVRSVSHVRYLARIYVRREVDCPPGPGDYALGSFVRIALRAAREDLLPLLGISAEAARHWSRPTAYAVGVIYDTVLLSQGQGSTAGLRLSNELQREVFAPDCLEEQAVLVWIQLVGTLVVQHTGGEVADGAVLYSTHGVPLLAAAPHSEVARMTDGEVRSFHLQREAGTGAPMGSQPPYLGYYGLLAAPGSALLPQVRPVVLDYLERLFPEHAKPLRLLKRMSGWQRLAGAMG